MPAHIAINLVRPGEQFHPDVDTVSGTVTVDFVSKMRASRISVQLIGISKAVHTSSGGIRKKSSKYELVNMTEHLFPRLEFNSPSGPKSITFKKNERIQEKFSFKFPDHGKITVYSDFGVHKVDLPPTFFAQSAERVRQGAEVKYYIKVTIRRLSYWSPDISKVKIIDVQHRPWRKTTLEAEDNMESICNVSVSKNRESRMPWGLCDALFRSHLKKFDIKFELWLAWPESVVPGDIIKPSLYLLSVMPPGRYRSGEAWTSQDGSVLHQSNKLGSIILRQSSFKKIWTCFYFTSKNRCFSISSEKELSRNEKRQEFDLANLKSTNGSDSWFCKKNPGKYYMDLSEYVDSFTVPGSTLTTFFTGNILNVNALKMSFTFGSSYHGRKHEKFKGRVSLNVN